jgi:hypothetical protein
LLRLQVMEDPVLTEDGHTYERSAITDWLIPGRMTSPLTGKRLPSRHLTPNHALRKSIEQWYTRRDMIRRTEKINR